MTERRVTCTRHHWLFSVTEAGIAIKCRAGECRAVHVVTWAEVEAKRREVQPCGILAEKGGKNDGRIYPSWEVGSLHFQEGRQGSQAEAPEKEEIT